MQRTCRNCGVTKEADLFVRNATSHGGRSNTCKACRSAYSLEWQRDNPEQVQATKHKYRERGKEKAHEWHLKNKDRCMEQARAWRDKNPKRAREYADGYYKKNRGRILIVAAAWYQRNKERLKAERLAEKDGGD